MSRAFGDFEFKDVPASPSDENPVTAPLVSVEPDFVVVDLDETCEFIVFACDGLFDVLNEEVVEETRRLLFDEFLSPSDAAERLAKSIEDRSQDNVSVLVVCLTG